MAQPFRTYESYFRDLQGGEEDRPQTGGPLIYQEGQESRDPETGIAIGAQQPETPPSPRTPKFRPFGGQERPAAFQAQPGEPQPQPRPTRALAAAVGGERRQEPSRGIEGLGGAVRDRAAPRSPYTSNFPQDAEGGSPIGGGAATAAPVAPGTYEYDMTGDMVPPPVGPEYDMTGDIRPPPTGGPVTIQPPVAMPAAAPTLPSTQVSIPAAPAPPPPVPPVVETLGQPPLPSYVAPEATQDYYNQLVSPLVGQLEGGYGTLGGAQADFYGQLPDIQTWEAMGGPALMETALGAPGPDQQAAEQSLIDILGTEYTGPGGLDLEAVSELYGLQASMQPYGAGALGTMAGAGSLLEGFAPGLTPGMRREESRRLLESDPYRDLTRQLGRDVSRLGGTTEREIGSAVEAAAGQTEAAGGLVEGATGALTGGREEISGDIATAQAEAQAERAKLEAAYEQFQAGGAGIDQLGFLEDYGITPDMWQNELTGLDVEAKAAKTAVMDDPRFASIKDVPLMEFGVTGKGRETLVFPDEWFQDQGRKLAPAKMAEVKKLARERQKALDEAGFDRTGTYLEGGKYAGVENVYWGGEDIFDPGQIAEYIQIEHGDDPATRHSIATEAQRTDFNTINRILGEADRLQEVDPYQAGQIVNQAEAYLDDLETQYKEAFGELREISVDFEKMRNSIRKKYRKSKRMEKGALIGGIVGGVLGGGSGIGAGASAGSSLSK